MQIANAEGITMPEILEASLSDKMAKAFDLSIKIWKRAKEAKKGVQA